MSEKRRSRWLPWAKFALRWAITLAIVLAAGKQVWLEKAKLAHYAASPSAGWLIASGAFYIAGLAACARFWRSAMRDMGGRPSWTTTLAAYYAGQLAKYVPGKGLVLVVRATMVQGPGTGITQAGMAVVQETSLMMATGATVSSLIMLFIEIPHRQLLFAVSIALALGLGVVAMPPAVSRLGSLVTKALPMAKMTGAERCRWKTVALGAILIAVGWLLMGLSLAAVLAALHRFEPLTARMGGLKGCAVLTAAVAVATTGGFVTFTPGGLGAREWILAETLGPVVGSEYAIVAAVVLRIVWIVAEAAAGGSLLIVGRQWNRNQVNPS